MLIKCLFLLSAVLLDSTHNLKSDTIGLLETLHFQLIFIWGLRIGEEITREAKKARKVGGLTGSSSDDSESESDVSDNEESDYESSKNMSSGDDDDFNPFRDESSEDNEDGEFTELLQQQKGT